MVNKIYCLYHQYTYDDYTCKHVGSYSSYEKAMDAKKLVEKAPGFIDYPDCFYIQVIELDTGVVNCPVQVGIIS